MKQYLNEMKKCIKLAKQATGLTSPNPLVGCIVLDKNGEEISSGYHKKYGENHAERNALINLKKGEGHTLIVNLEPCNHYGKTPPCSDLIIEKGIKRVVYGMQDPNPIVAGAGIKKLKENGIEVIGPILEDKCKELNEIFIKNKTENKVFVTLKTATTIDGKIATQNGDSKWITSEKSRKEVKNIRKCYDAILTSSSTVIADNPTMEHNRKIILDRELKTNFENAKIYKQGEIYIFYDEKLKSPNHKHINFIPTPIQNHTLDIEFILNKIYELGIMSILVEAGGKLNGSFLPYTDKLYHFIAPKVVGDNAGKSCFDGNNIVKISESFQLKLFKIKQYKPDILLIYKK